MSKSSNFNKAWIVEWKVVWITCNGQYFPAIINDETDKTTAAIKNQFSVDGPISLRNYNFLVTLRFRITYLFALFTCIDRFKLNHL